MKVRDERIIELKHQVRDVFDARLDVATARCGQSNGLTINQKIHNGKIVRR